MKPSIKGAGCTLQLVLVLVIILVGLIGLVILQNNGGVLGNLLSLPQPTPTNIVQPSVIDQIKPLGQLHTVSFFLSTVVDTQMRIGALNQMQRVLLVACGKVDAGVDLAKIEAKDIQAGVGKATIHLPDPEIFTTALFDDRKCTYVVLRDEGILLPPNLQLETAAREAAVGNFRETALANDILNQARQNAEDELRRLLILVGYKTVEFTP
jgi:Protein of unknown function (DUF4230)